MVCHPRKAIFYSDFGVLFARSMCCYLGRGWNVCSKRDCQP
jgi:hypothetical protein